MTSNERRNPVDTTNDDAAQARVDRDHYCRLMNDIRAESRGFKSFVHGISLGARLPIQDMDQSEFRKKIREEWNEYLGEGQ